MKGPGKGNAGDYGGYGTVPLSRGSPPMRNLAIRIVICLGATPTLAPKAAPIRLLSATTTSSQFADDPLPRLANWRKHASGSGVADTDELLGILLDTRGLAGATVADQREVILALLDLYGTGLRLSDSLRSERADMGAETCKLALRELRRWLDRPTERWLAREVLVRPLQHEEPRRAACALALAGRRSDELLLALSTCAREGPGSVREAALWSLSGWKSDAVDSLFLALLVKEDLAAPSPELAALEAHLRAARLDPESSAAERLLSHVRTHINAADWRIAAHAVLVSSALDIDVAAPLLIDALDAWSTRAEKGEPVRRMEYELSKALERRSGLRLGTRTARWRTWWRGYEAGQRPVSSGQREESSASLFGIRPLTDRIVFLIDHSTSMNGKLPAGGGRSSTEGWTRYEEAVEQMLALLEIMGPRTRFNVVLFDDEARPWRSELTAAQPSNLRAVRRWMLKQEPKGGTFLRRGFERAVGLGRDGKLKLADLEADTLIVLCDGETSEGPSWIRPLLERVQVRARWLIHTIQLGGFGDGALELLAEMTGGDHTRV